MNLSRSLFSIAVILLSLQSAILLAAETPDEEKSEWKIQEVYNYLGVMGDELESQELAGYCQFIVDSQEPEHGIFADKFEKTIYSVKAFHLLKRFGYKPKYPLSVTQHVGKDLHYSLVGDHMISEKSSPEFFRKWLDKTRDTYDAYAAGSLMGHFIAPHVMNLEMAGVPLEDSPFIPVFQQWLLDNQGENGYWNRPEDSDFNGWNGVMKMDGALRSAHIKLPRQDRMISTVLKHQNPKDANFTAAGGCTNHNALHTMRQWSKRNDLLMWQEIFLSMERFANSTERRYDPASGYFRGIPGFTNPPNFHATELTGMSLGNIIGYSRILLDPSNQEKLASQSATEAQEEQITPERVRSLLVKATGLNALADQRIKSHVKAASIKKH